MSTVLKAFPYGDWPFSNGWTSPYRKRSVLERRSAEELAEE